MKLWPCEESGPNPTRRADGAIWVRADRSASAEGGSIKRLLKVDAGVQ
ncbi:MAG: hypothetical protein MUC60_11055 [Oscillatoria sp. Prado101]|nr:hypothetical protein [Oscillatoria sp. Prado101]